MEVLDRMVDRRFTHGKDSTSSIQYIVHAKDGKTVVFSFDVALIREEGGKSKLIHDKKQGVFNIPAAGFYEWNQKKQKYTFCREGGDALFLAGCYRKYEDGDRFVILTTQANASMEPVHDRMPLILEREEAAAWLLEDGAAEGLLKKTPPPLERRTEYEQMSIFHL